MEFIINVFLSLSSGIIGSILGVIVARNYQIVETLRIELNNILLVLSNVKYADKYTINDTHGESHNPQHNYECSLVNDLEQSINNLEMLIDNKYDLDRFRRYITDLREILNSKLSSWNTDINIDKPQLITLHNKKIAVQINQAFATAQLVHYEESLLKLRNNLKEQLLEDGNKFEKIYSEFLNNAKNYINERSKILFPIKRLIKCR